VIRVRIGGSAIVEIRSSNRGRRRQSSSGPTSESETAIGARSEMLLRQACPRRPAGAPSVG